MENTISELRRLLNEEPGLLRIITDEQSGRTDADGKPYPDTDPRAFVCNPVVRIEGPNRDGQVTAHAEQDWCAGQPEAVLSRLLEASKAEERP